MDRVSDSGTVGQTTSAAGCDGGTARATGGSCAMPPLAIRGVRDGRGGDYCDERDAVDRIPGGDNATAGPGRCPEVNDYA